MPHFYFFRVWLQDSHFIWWVLYLFLLGVSTSKGDITRALSAALSTANEYCISNCPTIDDYDYFLDADGAYVIFLNMGLCPDGLSFDCPSCYSYSYRCPLCPVGTYYAACRGRLNPNPAFFCLQCTNALPTCGFYTAPGLTPDTCPTKTCGVGYYKQPGAFYACSACTNAPLLNSRYSGCGLNNDCPWVCNAGFYLQGGNKCTVCSIPTGAQLVEGGSGGKLTSCTWTCRAGQYSPSGASSCIQCPFNTYRDSKDQAITNCRACPLPTPNACLAGNYYVQDQTTATCNPISCSPCTNLPLSGFYYTSSNINGFKADATTPNSCYYASCPIHSEPGYQYTGCGGSSAGNLNYCTTINLWVATSTTPHTDLRYYRLPGSSETAAACLTAPCTPCPTPGTYNAQCPAKNMMISVEAGDCNSQCAPSIAFATFIAPQIQAVATASDCLFTCNVGYYSMLPSSRTCAACQDSSTCNPGFYTDPCLADGSRGGLAFCRTCPFPMGPESGVFRWKKPLSVVFGMVDSCQWVCTPGYYYLYLASSQLTSICADCNAAIPTHCNIGYYPSASCLFLTDARVAPFCDLCILPANSFAVSQGLIVNNDSSCSIQCNTGYWQRTPGVCVPWTPPSADTPTSSTCTQGGTFWGGGDAVTNNHCTRCPPESQPLPYPPSLQSDILTMWWAGNGNCSWTCLPGSFLDPLNGYCIACLPGTFKNTSGIGICTLCPFGEYQDQSRSQSCIMAPSNSDVTSDRRSFVCTQGFYLYFIDDYYMQSNNAAAANTNTICRSCLSITLASFAMQNNMSYIRLIPNQCQISSFACSPGFYRSSSSSAGDIATTTQNFFCVQCPSLLLQGVSSVQVVLRLMADNLAAVNAKVFATCGEFPSCTAYMLDEQGLSCPPLSATLKMAISNPPSSASLCSLGYYLTLPPKLPSINSIVPISSCALCMNTTKNNECPPGYTLTICKNGETNNTCRPCSMSLLDGQSWIYPDSCAWSCSAGYYYYYYYYQQAYYYYCAPCGIGTHQPLSNINASSCTNCPAGTFNSHAAAINCTACPPGTFSASSGGSNCSSCTPGTFAASMGSSACTACSAGTYTPTSSTTTCYTCPADVPYSNAEKTNCSAPPPPCPPGFYLASSLVFPANIPTISSTICSACTLGIACPGGTSAPQTCPPGTPPLSLHLATNLSQCGIQQQQQQQPSCIRSTSAPQVCPPNTSTQGLVGALSTTWCSAKPGFYGLPGTAASLCPYDHYCPAASVLPIICPAMFPYAHEQSFALNNCTADMQPPCRTGYYLPFGVLSVCLPCPSGCYCPYPPSLLSDLPVNIMACDNAPTGMWWSPMQSTSRNDCISKIIVNQEAANCPTGSTSMLGVAQPLTSSIQCRAYAGYYFVPGSAASGVRCPAGYYCPPAALQPILCPTSDHCKTMFGIQPNPDICPPGASAPRDTCINCPPAPSKAYYATAGSCVFCCELGYILTSTTSLQQQQQQQCISAPNTSYCLMTSSSSSSLLQASLYMPPPTPCLNFIPACLPCLSQLQASLVGIKTLSSAQFIAAASLSLLSTSYGPASCAYTCQTGYVFSGSSLSLSLVLVSASSLATFQFFTLDTLLLLLLLTDSGVTSVCLPCPMGTYAFFSLISQNTTCTQCPANTFSPFLGATACLKCNAWGYSAPGSSSCDCIPGTHRLVSSASTTADEELTCIACADGAPQSDPTNPYVCISCPAGTVCSPNRQILELQCGAGGYRSSPSSVCEPCPPGFFSAAVESTQCLQCPSGTYAENHGGIASTACVQCPIDTYSIATGAISSAVCQPCAAGFVSLSPLDTSKCVCPPLKYFDSSLGGGICRPCADQCNPNAHAVAVLIYNQNNNAEAAACLNAGSTASDFTCVCNQGFYGDGIIACTRCSSTATVSLCICPFGFYYNYNKHITNAANCTVCRTCPPAATTVQGSQCLSGSTADTTRCICPALHYYSEASNQCIPCTPCPPGADTLSSCPAGASADQTQCVCSGSLVGDGYFCS